MNYNSLIEIGSKANVILRFKAPTNINGVDYAANEPYIYLKDVNAIISYSNQDKTGSTDVTVIANSDVKPRTVVIGGFPFSRKIASLLACFKGKNIEYFPTLFKTLPAIKETGESEGTIFLVDDIQFNDKIFVYNNNFEVISFTYNAAENSLKSSEFEDEKQYLISFSSVKMGTKYDLNKAHIPYMSLEIQGVGNIDKVKKEVLMYFDKVSLNSIVNFTFIQDDIINVPLEFYIIDDKNNYVVFED
jgi:hypothetical protein